MNPTFKDHAYIVSWFAFSFVAAWAFVLALGAMSGCSSAATELTQADIRANEYANQRQEESIQRECDMYLLNDVIREMRRSDAVWQEHEDRIQSAAKQRIERFRERTGKPLRAMNLEQLRNLHPELFDSQPMPEGGNEVR